MTKNRNSLRREVMACLEQADYPALVALAGREANVAPLLLQFLYDPQDLRHWRALEGLGHVAREHPGQVGKIITRLLWLLNEDSGSFGWGAAAALGEIGAHNLSVEAEIIPMFVGFLEEPFSRAPMLWGIGRLAAVHPEALEEVTPFLLPHLRDKDPLVRALCARALGRLRVAEAAEGLRQLVSDPHPVTLYEGGTLHHTTVGRLAREALALVE